MYSSKIKGSNVPSDAAARDKLTAYVYEYLKTTGAHATAETFLKEVRFDKQQLSLIINPNEPPGFLLSWWSVFWDLYSSAPERRRDNPHSEEAKAFHDYSYINNQPNNGQMYMNGMQHNSNAPSPLGMPNDVVGMGPGPGNPGFFPNSHMRPSPTQPVNQPSPHAQMLQNQPPFMSPRYPVPGPGPRGPNVNVRMQQDFNQPPPGQPTMMPANMDPNRQGDGDFVWQGPPPSNPRMPTGPHPQSRGVPPMNQMGNMAQFPQMRPPNGPPVNGQPQPNGQMPNNMPINMPGPNGPARQGWGNNNMNYNSPSPGNHYGPPPVSQSGPTPGTIMPSPQGSAPYSPASHRMGTPNTGRDSSGPDGMYPMMKQVSNFAMNEPPNIQQAPNSSPLPQDPILESIKQSPSQTQDQANPEHNNIDYNIPYQENDQIDTAAILKIKESMQEEAKRFEKEPAGELIDGLLNKISTTLFKEI